MNLVSLTESPFDPILETKTCIRMLEQDAKESDIHFSLGEGYHKTQVRYVNGDPIRFAQVVLNFLSNAIGFEDSPVRIDVCLDASMEEPKFLHPVVMASAEHPLQPDSLFLICSVADSGGGLSADEQVKFDPQDYTGSLKNVH
jgi:signal transduction histidine kinase